MASAAANRVRQQTLYGATSPFMGSSPVAAMNNPPGAGVGGSGGLILDTPIGGRAGVQATGQVSLTFIAAIALGLVAFNIWTRQLQA